MTRRVLLTALSIMLMLSMTLLTVTACKNPSTDYSVRFIVNGQEYYSQVVTESSRLEMPSDPRIAGYAFHGWFEDEACTKSFDPSSINPSKLKGDVYVYAKTTEQVASGSLVLEGFDPDGANAFAKNVENSVTTLDFTNLVTVADGDSWVVSDDPTGLTVKEGNIVNLIEGSNVFFVVVIAPNGMKNAYLINVNRSAVCTISFNTDGGTPVADMSVEEGTIVTAPTTTKAGYDFAGWDYDFTSPITQRTLIVTARWTAKSYTITFDAAGGSVSTTSQQVTFGQTFTLPTPTHTTKYFGGWYDGTTLISDGTWNYVENKSVTARWYDNIVNVSLYSKPDIVVSFNLNGATGNAPEPQTITTTNALTYPEIPTRSGYVFAGWYENSDCTGSPFNFSQNLTASVTLYAKWISPSYTYISQVTAGTNTLVSLSGTTLRYYAFVPLVSGSYTFYSSGSYDVRGYLYSSSLSQVAYNDDGGTDRNFTFTYSVTAGALYYVGVNAYGSSTTGTTTLYVTGSSTPTAGGVAAESALFDIITIGTTDGYEMPTPTLTGYQFAGWYDGLGSDAVQYTNANGTGIIPFDKTADCSMYARWTPNNYSVQFMPNGGSGSMSNQEFAYNQSEALTANTFTKPGYDFAGWTTNIDGTGTTYQDEQSVINLSQENGATVSLYAKWTPATYTITYNLAGGSVSTSNRTTYTIDTDTFALNNPTRVDHIFAGWTGTGLSAPTMNVAVSKGSYGDREYTATWIYDGYQINYVLNGGENNTNNPVGFTESSSTITLLDPSRVGYNFEGWFTTSTFETSTQITTIPSGSSADVTVYAKWTARTINVSLCDSTEAYVVSFNLNGATGTAPQSQTITGSTPLTYPQIPTRSGYIFAGWYANSSCSGTPYNFSTPISESKTLYAKWVQPITTMTRYEGVVSVPSNNTINIIGGSTRQYFAFVPLVSQTITITVGKTAWIYCSDSYSSTTGNAYSSITKSVNAGTVYYIGIESNLQNTLSSYVGTTYLNITGTGTPADGALGDGEVVGTTSVTYGQTTYNFASLSKVGYTFNGWVDADGVQYTNASGASVKAWDKAEDTALLASLTPHSYTISFNGNGGSGTMADQSFEYGTAQTLSRNTFEKVGHEFLGWATSATSSTYDYSDRTLVNNLTTVNGANIELYAVWAPAVYNVTLLEAEDLVSYDVSFNLNGATGTAPATQSVSLSNPLTYPSVPTRSGYAFAGWYSNSSCTGTPYDFSATIQEDITLYAKWVAMTTSYSTREYVDIANYNSSSSKKSVTVTGTGSSSANYYYFTIYKTGSYTIYGGLTSGDFYFYAYNATKSSTIKSNYNLYGSYTSTSASFTANAGDIIYVRLYKYSSSGSTGYGTFYVSGASYPTAGGTVEGVYETTVVYGSTFNFVVPSIDGYVFEGWETDDGVLVTDELGQGLGEWDITEDTSLVARLSAIEYDITYNLGGGVNATDNPSSYTADSETFTLSYPTMENKSFVGWTSSTITTPIKDLTIESGSIGDLEFTANWIDYDIATISYDNTVTAIKVSDEITPELFCVTCVDTDGLSVTDIEATIEGNKVAGQTISVTFVASSNGASKQVTITGIRVYGNPTVSVTNLTVSSTSNLSLASTFGAIAVDSFGTSLTVTVAYVGEGTDANKYDYSFTATDSMGNQTTIVREITVS